MSEKTHFHHNRTPEEAFVACADFLVDRLAHAIGRRGIARIALAGGSTPRRLYQMLAENYADALAWDRVEFFFGDERNVPRDHPDSNFRMAQRALFRPLGIQPHQTFPMISDQQRDPEHDAMAYEALLRQWASDDVPRFDVALLGLGDDGHFASLFPDTPALGECSRLAVVNPVEKIHGYRLTLTFPVFEAARDVVFLVIGNEKRDALARVHAGYQDLPAEQLASRRVTHWFIDQASWDT